jgi:hypothetical protein
LRWDEAGHAADSVFDTAFLPRRVWVAEEGLHQEALQGQVRGELGAIVEGDGVAQRLWQGFEQAHEMAGDTGSDFAFDGDCEQEAGSALVHGRDRLTVFGEHHEVGLPMVGGLAVGGLDRALIQGTTAFDEACGASASLATPAALALAARQIAPPAVVCGAVDLGVDEAVDALVGDHLVSVLAGQSASDLLGRPAAARALQHRAAQAGLPFQARARSAPRSRLLLGIAGFVTDLNTPIAAQFPRDR